MLCECGSGKQPKKKNSRFCQGHHLKVPNSPRSRGNSHPRWNHNKMIPSQGVRGTVMTEQPASKGV